jgi:hypothetical protein
MFLGQSFCLCHPHDLAFRRVGLEILGLGLCIVVVVPYSLGAWWIWLGLLVVLLSDCSNSIRHL